MAFKARIDWAQMARSKTARFLEVNGGGIQAKKNKLLEYKSKDLLILCT
jgi:hypothetical protein